MKKTKLFISVVLVLVLSLALSISSFAAEVRMDVKTLDEIPAELSGKVVILHSNDVHGAIKGYATIAQLKKDVEAKGAEVLLIDLGDFSQGDPYVTLSKGASAVQMMNAVGYDYAALGNHEFDFGFDNLKKNIEAASFKILCADVTKDGETILPAHDVYVTKGGVKLGFFGLETPETLTKVHPSNVVGLHFAANSNGATELNDCAQAEADALKTAGADLVIALTHLGIDKESAGDGHRSSDVYAATTGIDFILDGHSHTTMTAGENGEPIQSTGTKFAYIGVVVIDEATKKIESNFLIATEGLEQDADVAAAAQKICDEVDAEYGAPFAKSEVSLNGAKAPQGNRDSETNNGDLITDALLWSVLHQEGQLEVADENVVAITNGGGIRAPIEPGDVTPKDVNTVLPFGNTVAVCYVKGSELLEALEASTYMTPIGGFPQTSGITWTLDTTKEYDANEETYPDSTYYGPKSINRVTITAINGKAFDPEAVYAVATNDFCTSGGDTYYVFKNASGKFDTGIPMDEALMQYITEELKGVISAEKYAEPRGSLTIIEAAEEPEVEEPAVVEPKTEEPAVEEPKPEEPKADAEYYTVVAGDCLWSISQKYYGTGTKWGVIYDLNSASIKDPRLIYIGQVIRVK